MTAFCQNAYRTLRSILEQRRAERFAIQTKELRSLLGRHLHVRKQLQGAAIKELVHHGYLSRLNKDQYVLATHEPLVSA